MFRFDINCKFPRALASPGVRSRRVACSSTGDILALRSLQQPHTTCQCQQWVPQLVTCRTSLVSLLQSIPRRLIRASPRATLATLRVIGQGTQRAFLCKLRGSLIHLELMCNPTMLVFRFLPLNFCVVNRWEKLCYSNSCRDTKSVLLSIGIRGNFTEKSFKVGGVSLAIDNNVPLIDVQSHGRWKSLETPLIYTEKSKRRRLEVSKVVV